MRVPCVCCFDGKKSACMRQRSGGASYHLISIQMDYILLCQTRNSNKLNEMLLRALRFICVSIYIYVKNGLVRTRAHLNTHMLTHAAHISVHHLNKTPIKKHVQRQKLSEDYYYYIPHIYIMYEKCVATMHTTQPRDNPFILYPVP